MCVSVFEARAVNFFHTDERPCLAACKCSIYPCDRLQNNGVACVLFAAYKQWLHMSTDFGRGRGIWRRHFAAASKDRFAIGMVSGQTGHKIDTKAQSIPSIPLLCVCMRARSSLSVQQRCSTDERTTQPAKWFRWKMAMRNFGTLNLGKKKTFQLCR